jgi:hypothetical protein
LIAKGLQSTIFAAFVCKFDVSAITLRDDLNNLLMAHPLTADYLRNAVHHALIGIADGKALDETLVLAGLDFMDCRKDCSDFALHGLLRLIYQFKDHFSPELWERSKSSILNFKYWPDEPGVDELCTWTENHHILYASAGYLAGQYFPDEIFSNSGHTGREKMTLTLPRLQRWLDLRFCSGFSEWLSHVYYDEDLLALLSLADFCQDSEIRGKAEKVVDLIALDMALNSYQGVFGSTHGRSYSWTKKWSVEEPTSSTQVQLFGWPWRSTQYSLSVITFRLSKNYHLHQ